MKLTLQNEKLKSYSLFKNKCTERLLKNIIDGINSVLTIENSEFMMMITINVISASMSYKKLRIKRNSLLRKISVTQIVYNTENEAISSCRVLFTSWKKGIMPKILQK